MAGVDKCESWHTAVYLHICRHGGWPGGHGLGRWEGTSPSGFALTAPALPRDTVTFGVAMLNTTIGEPLVDVCSVTDVVWYPVLHILAPISDGDHAWYIKELNF